jgi:class 3 adenylate cyclase
LDAFLVDNEDVNDNEIKSDGIFKSDPIAEFFTDTTIIFADIVGFTAWSSVREPKQVFSLLETIYHNFDTKAKRRGVFKVETIGDCYVAVTGLPTPRKDHFTAMAKFARDCVDCFGLLTQQLEAELGPETADLALRVGLHSGPVTAGVLRGDKAQFQLFGDTVSSNMSCLLLFVLYCCLYCCCLYCCCLYCLYCYFKALFY